MEAPVVAEARQRVERLLERPETLALTAGELGTWRGIEVLEYIGTTEARRVLEKLASGAAGARTTEAAKAALERLAQRPSRARSGAD